MYLPSGPNSSTCAAVAPYAGPVVLPRLNTKICPFEFTATPEASPKCRSLGSLKKFGTESNGISGTACCANSAGLTINSKGRRNRFIVVLRFWGGNYHRNETNVKLQR